MEAFVSFPGYLKFARGPIVIRTCNKVWLSFTSFLIFRNAYVDLTLFMMLHVIWYHLYDLKNFKNTYGDCRSQPATLSIVSLLHECF